ncbi:MFS transporter [Streptomyces sp. H10-C2]|uniref:MFS transporter n=1 Tax=unclassified Streptomyces TaxID=2593676 RepID=UPI0024B8CE10|nr:MULTISPECIES: MFS transporter [unclassified Streptomyces]MDJ0343902.1 MFS transporter [Streptomyces sp. PH10-H1]MDJ0373343.1 MFS transporter [Streptomyces sp. H10-C2]
MNRPWPAAYARLLGARLLLRSYFFLPYIVLYARQVGVSLGTLLVIEAVFALLIVLMDLPAGLFADRIGPRQALAIGAGMEGAAALLLGCWPHALVFWLVQPLFAAATALTQGSDAGLAGALLRRAGRGAEFESGERLFQAGALGWNAVVFAAASAFSLISLRATFVASGIVLCLTVALALSVPDARSATNDDERPGLVAQLTGVGRAVRDTAGLRWDLTAMVLTGTAFSILLYLTPVYVVGAGIDERLVGLVAAAVALGAALLLHTAPDGLGTGTVVLAAVAASAALASASVALVLAGILVVQCAQGRLLPSYRALVLRDLADRGDATAMSVVTTASSLGFAVLAPFLGILVARLEPDGLALVCALLFSCAGATLLVRMRTARRWRTGAPAGRQEGAV